MLLLSVALSILFVAMLGSPVSASQSDAAIAISSAQHKIVNCYGAARAAEAAGANITSLAGTLNEAGALLSRAASHGESQDFLINVVGSIIGAFAVMIGGIGVWIFMRRKYGIGDANAVKPSAV
jgi:hypothetical protein